MTDYNDIPDVLYYYCNKDDFIDLITNKRIKLIDLQKYDDFFDFNKLIDIIRQEIINSKTHIVYPYTKAIPFFKLYEAMSKNDFNLIPLFYAFTLTSNCNKWYMYQKNTSNLCIGIKTELFKNLMDIDMFNFNKIIYDIKEFEESVNTVIDNFYSKYLKDPDFFSKAIKDNDNNLVNYIIIDNNLINNFLKYKNSYFADENEYRLIYNSDITKYDIENANDIDDLSKKISSPVDYTNISLSGTQFMEVNNQLVSYRYLGYNDMLNLIDSVYINPTSKITESDLKLLLSANNINFDKITKTVLK